MKIVDRKTFLAMPAGTLFAKYEPCNFGELAIKEETIGEADFQVQDLIPWFEGMEDTGAYLKSLDAIERGEPSPPLDYDCIYRDGRYDKEQMFAVFERRDAEALIARLQRALADGYTGE